MPIFRCSFLTIPRAFGPRLPPLESLNLLLFGYTPYIPTTDQPLAQKLRLKMIMPKCDVFFKYFFYFYLLQFFVLHFNLNTRLQWLREILKGAQVQSSCNTIAAPLEMLLPRHRLYRSTAMTSTASLLTRVCCWAVDIPARYWIINIE